MEARSAVPRLPVLHRRSTATFFMTEPYRRFVRQNLVSTTANHLDKLRAAFGERVADATEKSQRTDGLEGGQAVYRWEDLQSLKTQWLVITKLVGFLQLQRVCERYVALMDLRRLLTRFVSRKIAEKRRAKRQAMALSIYLEEVPPVTEQLLASLPLFRHWDRNTLRWLVEKWYLVCSVDEPLIDEGTLFKDSNVYLLMDGTVEVTKRLPPTTDVLAHVFARRSEPSHQGHKKMNPDERMSGAVHAMLLQDSVRKAAMRSIARDRAELLRAEHHHHHPATTPGGRSTCHDEIADFDDNDRMGRDLEDDDNTSAKVEALYRSRPPNSLREALLRHVNVVEALTVRCDTKSALPPSASAPNLRNNRQMSIVFGSRLNARDTVKREPVLVGLLPAMENAASLVGVRTGGTRATLWCLPRNFFAEGLKKTRAWYTGSDTPLPPSAPLPPGRLQFEEHFATIHRSLRLDLMDQLLRPSPQSLRNCNLNFVFRDWPDAILEDLIALLRPRCYLAGEVMMDTTLPSTSSGGGGGSAANALRHLLSTENTESGEDPNDSNSKRTPPMQNGVMFIARGVASLQTTKSCARAAVQSKLSSSSHHHHNHQSQHHASPPHHPGSSTLLSPHPHAPSDEPRAKHSRSGARHPNHLTVPATTTAGGGGASFNSTINMGFGLTRSTRTMLTSSSDVAALSTTFLSTTVKQSTEPETDGLAFSLRGSPRIAPPSGAVTTTTTAPLNDPCALVSTTHGELIGPWQSIGDVASLVTERRSYLAIASTPVDAWVCSKDQILSVVQTHPSLLLSIYSSIRQRKVQEVRERGTGMLRLFLAGDPILKPLAEKARWLDELVECATPFWFPPHELIAGGHNSANAVAPCSIMVFLDGSAYVHRPEAKHGGMSHNSNGGASSSVRDSTKENTMADTNLIPGTVLNTAAAILEQPWAHSFHIVAKTPVDGYEITTDALSGLLERLGTDKKGRNKAQPPPQQGGSTPSASSFYDQTTSQPAPHGKPSAKNLELAAALRHKMTVLAVAEMHKSNHVPFVIVRPTA